MSNDNYAFISSIGSQEIYIGTNDQIGEIAEVLDKDPEVLYDYTFNISKEFAIELKEISARQHPNYKVIELLEAKA
ncbi:hypothetical protein [Paenibacillus oryzisoli]|uniref:Uncharacterized protein n=1 Tax=Paenibacillus oryzisoli TaxID=1850517 RepID=A0A198ADY9_9BACL|nr:hypothetical protein [Paenibacillus oryzisoli]OAS19271.1 hypothetical protein A8708_26540 [Paenibacillus oryzisoli]